MLFIGNLLEPKIYHLEFKRYKSTINALTRINKLKYYKTFFSEHKINSKPTWEAVRSLINVKIKLKKTNFFSKYKQPNRN